jgi:hypothetical protein
MLVSCVHEREPTVWIGDVEIFLADVQETPTYTPRLHRNATAQPHDHERGVSLDAPAVNGSPITSGHNRVIPIRSLYPGDNKSLFVRRSQRWEGDAARSLTAGALAVGQDAQENHALALNGKFKQEPRCPLSNAEA